MTATTAFLVVTVAIMLFMAIKPRKARYTQPKRPASRVVRNVRTQQYADLPLIEFTNN